MWLREGLAITVTEQHCARLIFHTLTSVLKQPAIRDFDDSLEAGEDESEVEHKSGYTHAQLGWSDWRQIQRKMTYNQLGKTGLRVCSPTRGPTRPPSPCSYLRDPLSDRRSVLVIARVLNFDTCQTAKPAAHS